MLSGILKLAFPEIINSCLREYQKHKMTQIKALSVTKFIVSTHLLASQFLFANAFRLRISRPTICNMLWVEKWCQTPPMCVYMTRPYAFGDRSTRTNPSCCSWWGKWFYQHLEEVKVGGVLGHAQVEAQHHLHELQCEAHFVSLSCSSLKVS